MRRIQLLLVLSATACSDAAVTKFNTSPTAEISSHVDGDTVREGYAESLRGVVGDPNHGIDPLSVSWLVDGTAVCTDSAPDTEGVVTCEHTFEPTGGQVVLEVRDPEGASDSAHVTLDVQPTDAPEVEILAPTMDGVYYVDQQITFQGTVSDGEDAPDDLTVTWETDSLGDLGFTMDVSSEGAVEAFGRLDEGEHAVRLRAVDSTGKEGVDTVVIEVGPPNSPPSCSIILPEDGSSGADGALVRFEATVDDVDVPSDWLTVTWQSDEDGDLGESTPTTDGEAVFSTIHLSVATHTITMTVADEVGATCTDLVSYTVGTPPEVDITSPESGSLHNETEPIEFIGTVIDDQDLETDLILDWSSDVDGTFSTAGADADGNLTVSEELSAGPHTITVRATDTIGLYDEFTLELDINAVPTTPTVTIDPDPAFTADTLTATATGSIDPDDSGTVTYSYAWYEDGILSSVSTDTTFPDTDTVKGSTYRVVVTPSDGMGDGTAGEASVTIQNTPPVLVGPTLSASTVVVGDTLTCAATGSDGDGDVVDFRFEWSDGSTDSTYKVTSADDPGDVITCTATADDNDGGTDVGTVSATVLNTDPVIDSIVVDPVSATVGEVLTCVVSVSDVDGDTPTIDYLWSSGDTSDTYTILDTDTPGDIITCTVVVTDADGGSVTDSAIAVVDNTDPVVDSISVDPASAKVNEVLTCEATASDADGGTPTIDYAWSTGATGATYTISVTDSPGDVITCTATAYDTDGGSGTGTDTASATVENTDPVMGTVTISPSSAHNRNEIECSTTATDDDGGTPTITYAWSGVSDYGPGATLDLETTSAESDEVITCTATATDIDGGSVSGTATITLDNRPPSVTVTLSPSMIDTNDDLTCTATFADDDGDTLASGTLSVTRNGTEIFSDTSALTTTLSGSAGDFESGDELVCTFTADDGKTDGVVSASETIEVMNSAPSAPVVAIEETCHSAAFDGVDDLIEVSSYAGLTLGSTFTVEAWVYWEGTDTNRYQTIAAQTSGSASGTHEWHFSLASSTSTACGGGYPVGALVWDMFNSGACSHTNTAIPSGTWTHVAAVYSGGETTLFINGQDDTVVTRTLSRSQSGSESLTLGWGSDNGEDWTFDGDIDAVSIAASARYSGSFAPVLLTRDSDTLSLWNLDEGTGTTSIDPVGGSDAVLDGTAWLADCKLSSGLICSVDIESTDPDSDPITYSFAWEDPSGSDFTGAVDTHETGDTVEGIDLGGEETWTCTVTPSDGTTDGTPGTASITTASRCDLDDDGYDANSIECGGTDCDDYDATSTTTSTDFDCDGIESGTDCDDTDPLVAGPRWVLEFSGTDKMTKGANSAFEFGMNDAFTISYWAYYTSSSQATLVKGTNSTKEYAIQGGSNNVTLTRQDWGVLSASSTVNRINQWAHYTVVYDAGSIAFYQDGASSGSGTGFLGSTSSSVLTIGNHEDGTDPLNGKLAGLAIWSEAHSAADIQDYADGAIDASDMSSLLVDWAMDEGTGTFAYDSSGNGHTATISGAAWTQECVD